MSQKQKRSRISFVLIHCRQTLEVMRPQFLRKYRELLASYEEEGWESWTTDTILILPLLPVTAITGITAL